MRNILRFLTGLVILVAPSAAVQSQAPEALDIYVFDTEGGEAVLFVSWRWMLRGGR